MSKANILEGQPRNLMIIVTSVNSHKPFKNRNNHLSRCHILIFTGIVVELLYILVKIKFTRLVKKLQSIFHNKLLVKGGPEPNTCGWQILSRIHRIPDGIFQLHNQSLVVAWVVNNFLHRNMKISPRNCPVKNHILRIVELWHL